MEIAGATITVLGSVFLFLGTLGLIRMPDVYNRIQAGTKATTIGILFTVIGLSLVHPDWALRLIVLALFVLFTNPISSHVLARAAHTFGVPVSKKMKLDKLAERLRNEARSDG